MSRTGILIVVCVLLASACAPDREPDDTRLDDGRLMVVGAFFPIADVVQRIGGRSVDVTDLTPTGAEPHDLELTSDALDQVLDADLVVYLSGFQPALDEALAQSRTTKVDLRSLDSDGDPHIWLEPFRWERAVQLIGAEMQAVHRSARTQIRENTRAISAELEELDRAFYVGLGTCERDLVVTAHDGFSRLAKRYALRVESIAGVSPEAEPDPRRLAEIESLVRREGVTTVFTEPLMSPEVAETIADETGARLAVLDPIESEPAGGYDAAMHRNLEALREALGCQ